MTRSEKTVRVVGALAVAASAVLLAVAVCPLDWLRPLGGLIRRPDDLTPDRHQRLQMVCWLFGLSGGLGGLLLRRCATLVSGQFHAARQELREAASIWFGYWNLAAWSAFYLCVAGIVFRASFLTLPMAYDESYSFVNFASKSLPLALGEYNSTNNHLLNTLGMHVSYLLFGQRDWALRLPAFVCGALLLPAAWFWARERFDERVGLVLTALVAVSPPLVSYSVNARGYIFVTLAAVVLDTMLARIAASKVSPRLNWILAWIAGVAGCWAMPLMVYPLVGILAWFVLEPALPARRCGIEFVRRVRSLILFAVLAVPAVCALYAPAFVFRGMLFLKDPVVQSVTFSDYLSHFAPVWKNAFGWWVDGAIPAAVWLTAIAAGLGCLARDRKNRLGVVMPFAAALILTAVQSVAPPPRVFLYLSPWIALLASLGIVTVLSLVCRTRLPAMLVSLGIVAGGGWYLISRPLLFLEAERVNYVSVPDVIARLDTEIKSGKSSSNRLIAPLPCDLPSIYYMDRRGFRIPVNGTPEPGETVWLIARKNETPDKVLHSKLVQLGDWGQKVAAWRQVARFEKLVLYRAETKTGKASR